MVVESKSCHYVIFEAESHLKLLPPSILDISKVFVHIDLQSICIVNWYTVTALNNYTHTPLRRLPLCPCCYPSCAGASSHHAGILNCADIVNPFVLASWPLLCRCCCSYCAGTVALVALVLPLSAAWSITSYAA